MGYSRYTENFKRDAVRKCELHNDINWVSDLLGVQPNTLRKWMKEYSEQSDEERCETGS